MKQEFRGLLAIVLSIAILGLWYKFFAPSSPPPQQISAPAATATTTPTSATPAPVTTSANSVSGSVTQKNIAEKPSGKSVTLENDLIRIQLNTDGGIVTGWELKKFTKNGNQKEVSLADADSDSLDVQLNAANFEVPVKIPFTVTNQTDKKVELRWVSGGLIFFKRFFLDADSYQLRLEVEFTNNKKETIAFTPSIDWTKIASEESPQRGAFFFKTPPDRWSPIYFQDGSFENIPDAKLFASQTFTGKIGWVGAQSRYFLGGVVPEGKEGDKLEIGHSFLANGDNLFYTKLFLPAIQILPGDRWLQQVAVYGGPKELKHLQAMGANFDKVIGYGWTSIIATPILYLLQLFYRAIHNYGVAIILLTVLIKIFLNPINRKSMESMKKMQALQPRLKEIREKYANDKQRQNMETMQLFKAHKINPAGGCLPMLLQFPIYIALYKVLWNSVELYHAHFFWFYKDLSAPDPYFIMPILLGVTMFFQTKMTPNPSADPSQQKMMMFMPLMFAGFMIFLPVGLTLYILVNTTMTILQQWMYQHGIKLRDLVRGQVSLKS